jgi:hypothetical protein
MSLNQAGPTQQVEDSIAMFPKELTEWQQELLAEFEKQNFIHFDKLNGEATLVYAQAHDGQGSRMPHTAHFHGLLPCVKSIVVGVDIREYSRRSAEQQLFLTLALNARIRLAIELLRSISLLPYDEPRIIAHTGDGAHVVFTFLDAVELPLGVAGKPGHDEFKEYVTTKSDVPPGSLPPHTREKLERTRSHAVVALDDLMRDQHVRESQILYKVASRAISFVLTLNAILHEDGRRGRFQHYDMNPRDGYPTFPLECRYAMSYDNVLFLQDVNKMEYAVGSALVTCARILSTDKGSHLLVDFELIKDLEKHGGLNQLCDRQWKQDFHSALLDTIKVKSGTFRFADVFGFYQDTLLQHAMRHPHTAPFTYHIGSHNVSSIAGT